MTLTKSAGLGTAALTAFVAVMTTSSTAPWPSEPDRGCAYMLSPEIHRLYDSFSAAMASRDVDAVLGHFSDDAIVMGIGASTVRLGLGEIRSYYTTFLQRAPRAAIVTRTIRTDCNAATDSGLQSLELSDEGGAVSMPTRYTLSYAHLDGVWRIVHQHVGALDARGLPPLATLEAPPTETLSAETPPMSVAALPTGSITKSAADADDEIEVVLPQRPFALATSPPVILTGQPRLVPLVEQPVAVKPKPSIEPTVVRVPALPFTPAQSIPSVVLAAYITKPTAVAVEAPPAASASSPMAQLQVPPLPFQMSREIPPAVLAPLMKSAPTADRTAVVPPAPPSAPVAPKSQAPVAAQSSGQTTVAKPAATIERAPRVSKPAVVVEEPVHPRPAVPRPVVQRSAPPVTPSVAVARPTPKPVAAPRASRPSEAPTPTFGSDYKVGRWVDNVPVFD